jgi:hypothetical protein
MIEALRAVLEADSRIAYARAAQEVHASFSLLRAGSTRRHLLDL